VRRFAFGFAAIAASTLLTALLTVPAGAANGPPSSGDCNTGSTCQVELQSWIHFKGSYSTTGTPNTVVDIAPPPCLWIPIGDATTGSQAIIAEWGNNPAKAPTIFDIDKSVQQANDLLANPVPGEWYKLPVNPNAGPAGQAECLKLPLYAFVPPGGTPPGIDVPPQTLAQLAFAVLQTPGITNVEFNPAGASDTNLPTFVKVRLGGNGVAVSPDGHAYAWVTATLGANSATVWVMSSGLDILPGTSAATLYDQPSCGNAAMNAGAVTLGSGWTPAQISSAQVNEPIDCGVTYRQPGSFNLTVSVGWTACWAPTADSAPPAYSACMSTPVPGADNLTARVANPGINVREIQAVVSPPPA
jgi:hypothetical protein